MMLHLRWVIRLHGKLLMMLSIWRVNRYGRFLMRLLSRRVISLCARKLMRLGVSRAIRLYIIWVGSLLLRLSYCLLGVQT